MNAQYVMRLFKKEWDVPFCSILRPNALPVRSLSGKTNISVTDVAVLCGFDNYSYFTRIFKRFTNETPLNYRKTARGKR